MFSRLFASKRTGDKVLDPPASAALDRSTSPSTESASLAASAAPGSPTRVPLPASRSISPILGADADPAALHALFTTCPPKTLHTYALSRLEMATPAELSALASFFGALEPPPRLHCVRCHKGYFEVENDDRSCTMAHDDDSAEVEHVGYTRGKTAGGYETRWDCCGRTVEGDGDLGPPSGWCYEGKHTMDRKRARYRNDSTLANDLLQGCEARGCHRKRNHARIPIADDARSTRSARSESDHTLAEAEPAGKAKKRATRKRTQKVLREEDGDPDPDEDEPAPKKKKRKVA